MYTHINIHIDTCIDVEGSEGKYPFRRLGRRAQVLGFSWRAQVLGFFDLESKGGMWHLWADGSLARGRETQAGDCFILLYYTLLYSTQLYYTTLYYTMFVLHYTILY